MKPYYQDSAVTIYHGDCLDVIPCLGEAADAVIADPPYGTTSCKWDAVIPFAPMWANLNLVTKDSAAIVLCGSQPFSSALVMSNPQMFRHEWIWEKTHATGYLNAKKSPMRAHESILVFCKVAPAYNPQKTNGHIRKTATKRHDNTPVYGAQSFNELPYDSTERYPRSVLLFSSDKQTSTLHPTQKPVALMRYLVRTYTNEGDTVLDFTCGSGTTLLAASLEGRKAIGIEIEERYCEIAAKRMSQ